MFDVRDDFPFLQRYRNNKPIVYFDNAATTQKPRQTVERITGLYESGVSNVHRAVNFLANEVTEAFESSRQAVARFLGAQAREIVFVSNATQGINFVCSSLLSRGRLRVLTTTLEHHSNLVPWTDKCDVAFAPWRADGSLDMDAFASLLEQFQPDLVTVARASNFLGVLHPVEEIVALCRQRNAQVLVDASQSIAHEPHDVRQLDCDYLVFSGHKVYGPGGTGVLFIRNELMDEITPVLLGGSMVKEVHPTSFVPNDAPYRFEAGTPNIEGVIGLGAALEYVSGLGFDAIAAHERELVLYAKCRLARLRSIRQFGPPLGAPSAPLVAFQAAHLESGAVAKALGERANVIVRSGFHCAQPAHEQLGVGPTVRASFGIYNTAAEIDCMVEVLKSLTEALH